MSKISFNRFKKKMQQKRGRELQALDWDEFKDITEEARTRWEEEASRLKSTRSLPYDEVFMNHKFIVQIFHNCEVLGMKAHKVFIRRNDAKPVHSWHDLYRIKNEIFGEAATAIEVYPPKDKLVDDANIYWLWVLCDVDR